MSIVKDMSLAPSGQRKIDWVRSFMPALIPNRGAFRPGKALFRPAGGGFRPPGGQDR